MCIRCPFSDLNFLRHEGLMQVNACMAFGTVYHFQAANSMHLASPRNVTPAVARACKAVLRCFSLPTSNLSFPEL